MKNEEKDFVELVLLRNLQRRNGGRRHSIFFRTSAIESRTAPVSLSYPSSDDDTRSTMDPGLISSGLFLK